MFLCYFLSRLFFGGGRRGACSSFLLRRRRSWTRWKKEKKPIWKAQSGDDKKREREREGPFAIQCDLSSSSSSSLFSLRNNQVVCVCVGSRLMCGRGGRGGGEREVFFPFSYQARRSANQLSPSLPGLITLPWIFIRLLVSPKKKTKRTIFLFEKFYLGRVDGKFREPHAPGGGGDIVGHISGSCLGGCCCSRTWSRKRRAVSQSPPPKKKKLDGRRRKGEKKVFFSGPSLFLLPPLPPSPYSLHKLDNKTDAALFVFFPPFVELSYSCGIFFFVWRRGGGGGEIQMFCKLVCSSVPGTPINRLPIMAKQVLDLYELYNLVTARGGLVEVINKKQWQEIIKGLNLPSSITSAAFTLRTQWVNITWLITLTFFFHPDVP